MKIQLSLLILCNIILILPCFSENNHNVTNKIDDIKNYTTINSFALDLKKNFTSDILNKILAEADNTTSKPSGIKPRKKVELIETINNSTSNVTEKQHEVQKNSNKTTSRPNISKDILLKNNSDAIQGGTPPKKELKNDKNSTDFVKNNTKSSKEKFISTTNQTINSDKNTTKTNAQTVNLEGGSEISINSKNESANAKTSNLANSTKSNSISTPILPVKLINTTTTINPSKIKVNNNTLINPNSTNSTKIASVSSSASTSTTTTSTTTSTTTTTTTTTTTPKPKKPKITYSQEDVPAIGLYAKKLEKNEHGKSPVSASIEEPIVQPVKEDLHGNHRDYILPIVAFIFVVPILMGGAIISYRRIKDYWSTRHYRRMDFLVDGMYNE